jgi:hypothetical protein
MDDKEAFDLIAANAIAGKYPNWTNEQRCELMQVQLPASGYRTDLEKLHADMLAEIARLSRLVGTVRESFNRECDDLDAILRLQGLDPENCRTDGGSLKSQMVLGALEHRDVMLKREAKRQIETLREALRTLLDMDIAYKRGPKVEEAVEAARRALGPNVRAEPPQGAERN